MAALHEQRYQQMLQRENKSYRTRWQPKRRVTGYNSYQGALMTIESVTYITDLDKTYPAAGDNISEGDDHIRNIKKALENSFTGFTGAACTATEAELNDVGQIRTDLTTAEADIDALEADKGLLGSHP